MNRDLTGSEEKEKVMNILHRCSARTSTVEREAPAALPLSYAYEIPENYSVTERGVELAKKRICAVPLLWNGPVSASDGGLRTRILARVCGDWQEYELPKKAISRTSELVGAFCDAGLPGASDANARDLMRYLAACEDENIDAPVLRRSDAGGWIDDRHYAPFIMPRNCVSSVSWSSSGDWLDAWKRRVRPFVGARCAVAAAVGATLLHITGCRSHVVYLYGGSQGGKTAAQTAAAAFYGKPEEIMSSMYGTTTGVELLAAKRRDMALVLDERQTANGGGGQEDVERIVYMLAGGVGKLRGSKDGTLLDTARWRTVALISGEESLSKDSSQQGVYTRSLPLYGRPFENPEAAAACYPAFARDYGAFERWISFAVSKRENIRRSYDGWIADIENFASKTKISPTPSHVRYVANLATAEQYLCELAGFSEKDSLRSAGETILHAMKNFGAESDSYAGRALSALCQYVFSNMNDFLATSERRYGDLDLESGRLYITNERLRAFCSENGFDAGRIRQDWTSSGVMFEAKQRRIGSVRMRCCEIVLPKDEISFAEEK